MTYCCYPERASTGTRRSIDLCYRFDTRPVVPDTMFFFTSNAGRIRLPRLGSPGHAENSFHVHKHDSAVAVWRDFPFSSTEESEDRLVVTRQRPADEEPICVFEWRFGDGKLTVGRRWSGEFSIFVVEDPELLITSHLRFSLLLCNQMPSRTASIPAGSVWTCNLSRWPYSPTRARKISFNSPYRETYSETVRIVRKRITESVRQLPDSAALLLSGGLDSSIIAAVAKDLGKHLRPFVFAAREPVKSQSDEENDLGCARFVAAHLKLPLREILIDRESVIQNVPLAILLSETPRGTIVDPCTALIEVAKKLSRAGFSSVVMGEAADDLFGSFTFALRYKRGQGLRKYYRAELDVGLPDEKAIVQRVFEAWGISVIDPFWTRKLKAIGYNLPLSFRLDPERLMKRVLRDGFQNLLPPEIIGRPKVVTRNGSQIRYLLESHFGKSRERYRPLFHQIFRSGATWPENLHHLRHLNSWRSLRKP
jgi:asparagine synthetase B (glutamine-hydrolysing)